MKNIIIGGFFAIFALTTVNAQNQDYVISDLDGNAYENNSVHTFNQHGTVSDPIEEAKLHLLISNESSDDIYIRAEIIEMVNTDGQEAQFCIGGPSGNCFTPISTGNFYPSNDGGIMYANSNWGMFDYILNLDSTNLSEYKFRFVQTDGAGNEIENTNFFLTYIYDEDATLGLNNIESISIAEVYPTVAKGFTQVNLKEAAKVQIFNMEGKVVQTTKLNSGTSQLSLAGLTPGVYIVSFSGESGMTTQTRVIVK